MGVKKDIFGISKGRRFIEKVIWLVTAIVCIAGVLFLMDKYVKDRTETIDVAVVGTEAITQNTLIESYDITKYSIIKKEYTENMILWENKDEIIGNYASYYLKENTPIYKDSIFGERRYKNEWMYEIEDGKEVLTIPFDYRLAGGNILVPGDRVRIRVIYEGDADLFSCVSEVAIETAADNIEIETSVVLETEDELNGEYLWEEYEEESSSDHNNTFEIRDSDGESVQVVTLFAEIEVIDMLANGESIYEKYIELKDMTESERSAILSDESFLTEIVPDAFIVIVTEDEATDYLQALAVDGNFLVTILPREKNETVLDKIELIEDINDQVNESIIELEEGVEE